MNNDLTYILKRFSLFAGLILAVFSIWFSWDGLDQTVTGNNPNYSELAQFAGAVLAVVMTLLQFIFNTSFNSLSLTLKIAGFASYVYSIYTNYLGIGHIFGFPEWISAFLAVGMDVLPESMISWSLDEHTKGDFLGNLLKGFMGTLPSQRGNQNKQHQPAFKAPEKKFTFTPDQTHQDTKPRMPVPTFRPSQPQNNPNKKKGGDGGRFTGFFGE